MGNANPDNPYESPQVVGKVTERTAESFPYFMAPFVIVMYLLGNFVILSSNSGAMFVYGGIGLNAILSIGSLISIFLHRLSLPVLACVVHVLLCVGIPAATVVFYILFIMSISC